MKLLKTFFLCLFLNLIGYVALNGLASTANSQMLSLAYISFGFLLIVSSDLLFIKELYLFFKKGA